MALPKGFKHTQQTKDKISKSNKGKSKRGVGWKCSQETIVKISKANRGRAIASYKNGKLVKEYTHIRAVTKDGFDASYVSKILSDKYKSYKTHRGHTFKFIEQSI